MDRVKAKSGSGGTSIGSYSVGDHVKLTQDREVIIRYIGNVTFASGTYYGEKLNVKSISDGASMLVRGEA